MRSSTRAASDKVHGRSSLEGERRHLPDSNATAIERTLVAGPERPDLRASAVASLEGDDRRCAAGTRRPAPSRAPRHLVGLRCLPERLGELVPATQLFAIRLDLSARAGYRPADDSEHDQRRRRDRDQLEGQASSRGSEYGRLRPVDRDRPARRSRVRKCDNPSRRAVETSRPGKHPGSPFSVFASNAELSGRAKLVRVSCWPARSMTTRPSNPRSVVRGFVHRTARNSIAPASTPVSRPLASRVGTAITTARFLPTSRRQPFADVRLVPSSSRPGSTSGPTR